MHRVNGRLDIDAATHSLLDLFYKTIGYDPKEDECPSPLLNFTLHATASIQIPSSSVDRRE
jgi:hypothetical protein